MMGLNTIICFICLYAIMAISATLTTGLSNMLTMCQAAFYGIGAYVGVFLLNHFNVSFFLIGLSVMIVTGLSSLIVSYASIRLKGDAFILATLGFQMMVFTTIRNWELWKNDMEGESSGTKADAAINILGLREIRLNNHWILMLAVLIAVILLFRFYQRSPYGRLLRALRINNEFVETLGKDTHALKVQTFFISAALSGLAGLLYASWLKYIDPTMLSLNISILVITALFLGGKDHWAGALLGSAFVMVIPQLFDRFSTELTGQSTNLVTVISNAGQALYGVALIVLMFLRPQGLIEEKRRRIKPIDSSSQVANYAFQLQDKALLDKSCDDKPILEMKDVKFSYQNGTDTLNLLNGVFVRVDKGTTIALIGSNGAGKTTLFNIISGFEKHFKGDVYFNDQCITHEPSYKRSRMGIARMFQGVQLMPDLTLREYLVMSAQDNCRGENPFWAPFMIRRIRKCEEEKTQRALALLTSFFGRHEEDLKKYLSKLDEKTSDLSYGEQRIMAFIGLLMNIDNDTETLLLLDEPTSGVNMRHVETMKELIHQNVSQKRASVLMIEHKMSFVNDMAEGGFFLASDTGKSYGLLTPYQLINSDHIRKNYLGYGESD